MTVTFRPIHQSSLDALAAEIAYARSKFPSNAHLTTALVEEVGELAEELEEASDILNAERLRNLFKHLGALAQAQLQRKDRELIRKEALQVACVAMRIYEEGDETMEHVTDEQAKP